MAEIEVDAIRQSLIKIRAVLIFEEAKYHQIVQNKRYMLINNRPRSAAKQPNINNPFYAQLLPIVLRISLPSEKCRHSIILNVVKFFYLCR